MLSANDPHISASQPNVSISGLTEPIRPLPVHVPSSGVNDECARLFVQAKVKASLAAAKQITAAAAANSSESGNGRSEEQCNLCRGLAAAKKSTAGRSQVNS